MSKELWCAAHEKAVDEAMEANHNLSWSEAYGSDACAKRADEILQDQIAAMIDAERDRRKHK